VGELLLDEVHGDAFGCKLRGVRVAKPVRMNPLRDPSLPCETEEKVEEFASSLVDAGDSPPVALAVQDGDGSRPVSTSFDSSASASARRSPLRYKTAMSARLRSPLDDRAPHARLSTLTSAGVRSSNGVGLAGVSGPAALMMSRLGGGESGRGIVLVQ